MRFLAWKRQRNSTEIRKRIAKKTAEKASSKRYASKFKKSISNVFTGYIKNFCD